MPLACKEKRKLYNQAYHKEKKRLYNKEYKKIYKQKYPDQFKKSQVLASQKQNEKRKFERQLKKSSSSNSSDVSTKMQAKLSRFFTKPQHCEQTIESTYKICMEIAHDVAQKLGPGHSEAVYEAAMMNSLYDARIPCRRQVPYQQSINGHTLSIGTIDLEVDHDIILELKAGHTTMKDEFKTQLHRYLRCKKAQTTHDGPIIGCVVLFRRDGRVHTWRAAD